MGARPLRRVLQTEVEDQLAELLLKAKSRRANHQGWNNSWNDQVRDCLGGRHDASAINPYFAFWRHFVLLYVRLLHPFPMSTLFLPSSFSWWYLKGIALLFLWWWSMFVSAFFLGWAWLWFFQIVALGCLMLPLAYQLQVVALCPSARSLFLWAYCPFAYGVFDR